MANDFIRQSQMVTTYGPGAMIDLPTYSVIVTGLQGWSRQNREKVVEQRLTAKLCRILDVPTLDLFTPPHYEENSKNGASVAARVFPTWFIVNKAEQSPINPQWRRRRLVRWNNLDGRRFRDPDGKRYPVVSVRFVRGCRRGHIDDLDWRWFVHGDDKVCGFPFWLEERGTNGDMTETFVVCDCGAGRSLYEAFGTDTTPLGPCGGRRPWIGQYASEKCQEPYRILVRTASNSYFPQTMSVISLPEVDQGLSNKVTEHFDQLNAAHTFSNIDNIDMMPELKAAFDGISKNDVKGEFLRQLSQQDGNVKSEIENVPVKVAEFAILNKGDSLVGEDNPGSTFHAETLSRDPWIPDGDGLFDGIENLVQVHRLREVVALLGFTRFESISPDKDGELDLEVQRAALDESITWLPAYENRGEGIFVSFKKEALDTWLTRTEVLARGEILEAGWQQWTIERGATRPLFPGLPYIMLHSLSHMLMTSIALECGYPASSLRERIYTGETGHGILIYTGSSDADGTLGGLVQAGLRFASHLRNACQQNLLCSNDPVCAERRPDATYQSSALQGAACHGCLLTSETSCEQRNDFLDRALVIPTVSNQNSAFFDSIAL